MFGGNGGGGGSGVDVFYVILCVCWRKMKVIKGCLDCFYWFVIFWFVYGLVFDVEELCKK